MSGVMWGTSMVNLLTISVTWAETIIPYNKTNDTVRLVTLHAMTLQSLQKLISFPFDEIFSCIGIGLVLEPF
jgi:hypothetical protein